MSPLRKVLSWLAFGASIMSTQMCRLVASEVAGFFDAARRPGAPLPAVTERLLAMPWMAWAIPSALAAAAVVAVLILFRSAKPPEWKHHVLTLLSVLLCYSSVMSLGVTILAFDVLPHAFGSI
jgi:hypothetical protein